MFKDITDVMLARAYAVDFLLTHAPVAPAPPRRLLRRGAAWLLRHAGAGLTWSARRLAAPPAADARG